jgi:beta-glucosidase
MSQLLRHMKSRRELLAGGVLALGAALTGVVAWMSGLLGRHGQSPGGRRAPLHFPDGFLWGAATAAYQVEGAVGEDGRGTSIWDTFSHTPGKTNRGDTGDVAADHYHRLDGDLDLMAQLRLNAYRFSVAWPRVQPDGRGQPNQKGLDFYRRLVDGLLNRSITPMVTLYHWDLPQALQDRGGWTNRTVSERFAEYAEIVFTAFGDRVPLWITLNEPWVSAWIGYGSGAHAPGIAGTQQALAATHHLLLSHGLAIQAMRAVGHRDASLGITLNLSPIRRASNAPADHDAARRVDGNLNRLYLDPVFRGHYPEDVVRLYRAGSMELPVQDGDLRLISSPLEFLGVNYYAPQTVSARRLMAPAPDPSRFGLNADTVLPPGVETTEMGWPIQPQGLYDLLTRLHREYTRLPLYITENGAAFADRMESRGHVQVEDGARIGYLESHIEAAHRALRGGVDLRGYFVWSLLDNFEWAEGYSKRFGLLFVDYPTQRRVPKSSYWWYRRVIAANALPGAVDSTQ